MSEATEPTTNLEAAHLAREQAEKERRVALLWTKPHLADHEIPDALGIPTTLWSTLKADGDTPPLFQIGRRVFCKTSDLRDWLDAKARDGRPGSKRLRKASQAA
jgi:hypothetical protein